MIKFPTWVPDYDFHSPALLDFFLSSDISICSTMAFPQLGSSAHVVSVSIDFPSNSQCDGLFHRKAYYYFRAYWDGLRDLLRDVPWKDIFELGTFAAASEFFERVQIGIGVYISQENY